MTDVQRKAYARLKPGRHSAVKWREEAPKIQKRFDMSETLEAVGRSYGVSRQRMYQVVLQFDLKTRYSKEKGFLRGQGPEKYWLNRMLKSRQIPIGRRIAILDQFDYPTHCPIFGSKLDYIGGLGVQSERSPSLDRINPKGGYTFENMHILSWRANRMKKDGTAEEHLLIGNYLQNLTKKSLQL